MLSWDCRCKAAGSFGVLSSRRQMPMLGAMRLRAFARGSAWRLFAVYVVASLLPVLVLGLVLAAAYRRDANARGLAEGRAEAGLLARTSVEPLLSGDLSAGLTAAEVTGLHTMGDSAVTAGQIVRFRIRDLDGRVVFSSDGSALGGAVDDEALDAAHGHVVAEITRLNADDHAAGSQGARAAEVYWPLAADGSTRTVGVLEIYLPYGPIAKDVDAGLGTLYRDLGIGLAVLYVLLAAISWSATRRLRAQNELNRHQSLHDALTGLPNRALFHDRVAQALRVAARTGSQVAVMLLDLNRFKDVNDTLGHHYGDLLLGQVAERFSAISRAGDTVARVGGDEFAVLLCETTPEAAAAAAGRFADALHTPFSVKDISLDVEVSIGIAIAGAETDVETAMRHADVAMYEAKSQHLPFATYELTRDDNTVARLALLGDLRRAISGGDLLLHYQPKITTSGELHSVEALVRWQHPSRGLLFPAAFIPVAENTAVIHPLTAEILRQALVQIRDWLDRGWTIPVAVNISARSLMDTTFPNQVQRLLETTGVPAELLSLELTESAIMHDPARALVILEALSAMGIGLSIDDFGTGYSSMAYLKDLPVKELKIDRTFVKGMTTDDSDVVLVQSAVDLGHNLGLNVVAEGVEDAATQQALTEMGCDLLQGYYIRRPISAAELDGWLSDHLAPTDTATPAL